MTTMEFEASKMELIRAIVETDSNETIKKLRKYMRKLQKNSAVEANKELAPHSLDQINAWMDEVEAEEEAGIEGIPMDEVQQRLKAKYTWL